MLRAVHNHEVAGSCPALATENKEVTTFKVVTSFYLHAICWENECKIIFC